MDGAAYRGGLCRFGASELPAVLRCVPPMPAILLLLQMRVGNPKGWTTRPTRPVTSAAIFREALGLNGACFIQGLAGAQRPAQAISPLPPAGAVCTRRVCCFVPQCWSELLQSFCNACCRLGSLQPGDAAAGCTTLPQVAAVALNKRAERRHTGLATWVSNGRDGLEQHCVVPKELIPGHGARRRWAGAAPLVGDSGSPRTRVVVLGSGWGAVTFVKNLSEQATGQNGVYDLVKCHTPADCTLIHEWPFTTLLTIATFTL